MSRIFSKIMVSKTIFLLPPHCSSGNVLLPEAIEMRLELGLAMAKGVLVLKLELALFYIDID